MTSTPGVEQRLVDPLPLGRHGRVLRLGDHHHDLERGDRDRPDDALVVVVDLDGGGHGALDADAVAAHDRLDRLAVRARHPDVHGVGVLVAELEDVPDLDAPLDLQAVPAVHARVAGRHLAQVGPPADADVALDVDAAQVGVVDVGAGGHAAPAAQRLVGDHRVVLRRRADRAEAAGQRAERVLDLLRLGRADGGRTGGVGELLLVQRVVAAHQDQGERVVEEVDQGLDLAGRRGPGTGPRDRRWCVRRGWRRARERREAPRPVRCHLWRPAATRPSRCSRRNRTPGSGR